MSRLIFATAMSWGQKTEPPLTHLVVLLYRPLRFIPPPRFPQCLPVPLGNPPLPHHHTPPLRPRRPMAAPTARSAVSFWMAYLLHRVACHRWKSLLTSTPMAYLMCRPWTKTLVNNKISASKLLPDCRKKKSNG